MLAKEDLVKAGAGALLSTIVTVLFAQARIYFEAKWILLSLFFLTANFAIYAGLVAYRRTEAKHQDALDTIKTSNETLKSLELAIKSHIRFTWILSSEQLMLIEREKTPNCKSIWILTGDPSDDTGTSPWVQIIRNNLADGIKYTYVCLEKTGILGGINGLKETFRNHHDLCDVIIIDRDEYERFPYSHIVVYDPNNDGGEMDCYGEINAPEKGCWLRLTTTERDFVIDRLAKHAPKAKNISNCK